MTETFPHTKYPLSLKLQVLDDLKQMGFPAVCSKYKIPRNTVGNWHNTEQALRSFVPKTPEEHAARLEKQTAHTKQYLKTWQKLHPDQLPGRERLTHPFRVLCYYTNSNYRRVFKRINGVDCLDAFHLKPHHLFGIAKKQGLICVLTGVKLTAENVSCDHIISVTNGGTNGIENIRLVDKDINRIKLNYSDEEFIAMCRLVAEHNSGK